MSNITDYLVTKSNGLLKLQPEGQFSSFNSGSTEAEVSEFLYALVRNLKPVNVCETGTFLGISSAYIGQALKDNGFGKIHTLEILKENKEKAEKLWEQLELNNIECFLESSLTFSPQNNYEFIFLDSNPEIRFGELVKFYPFLKEGGFFGIHDLPEDLCQGNINPDHKDFNSWPYGDVPDEMRELLRTQKLVRFHLPTPRDCAFFYKPKPRYYKQ